jgi:transposase InsO family protein
MTAQSSPAPTGHSSRSSSETGGGQFAAAFDGVLADAGITAAKIPPRCCRADAYAERFVLTMRTEVTDRMLIVGERHLRRVLGVYAGHYNCWRPHRWLQLAPPRSQRPVVGQGWPDGQAARRLIEFC